MGELDRAQARLDEALAQVGRVQSQMPDIAPAIIDSIRTDGTVNLLLRGQLVPEVPVAGGYKPVKGETAQVLYVRGQYWVLGATGRADPAGASLPQTYMVQQVAATSGTYGTYTGAGWAADPRPTQGAQATDGSWSSGVWCFGAGAWTGLAGTSITSCRVTLARDPSEHGDLAGVPVHLYTHPHADLPTGTPDLRVGPSVPGTLSVGEQANFDLPIRFGEFLRDNPDGGIGVNVEVADYYLIYTITATVEVTWETTT